MARFFIFFVLVLGVFSGPAVVSLQEAHADFQLPGYATGGNVETEIQAKGKKITDIALMILGIACLLGMIWGGVLIGFGNPESGKKWLLGGVIGILIGASVFGLAAVFV